MASHMANCADYKEYCFQDYVLVIQLVKAIDFYDHGLLFPLQVAVHIQEVVVLTLRVVEMMAT